MSSTIPSRPKVLIIGAGIGGLGLAQALRKQGIPYEIFDRDGSASSRSQGWCMSLHVVLPELKASLPPEFPPIEQIGNTFGTNTIPGFGFFEGESGRETRRFVSSEANPFLRVNRRKLRTWLMSGLEINWGKRFMHYSQSDDEVVAFFEDGTSATGSILVGADGYNSRVRDQLTAEDPVSPERSPVCNIVGQVTLDKAQYEQILTLGPSFYVVNGASARLFVDLLSISQHRQSADCYWLLSWSDKAVTTNESWIEKASPEELLAYATELCKDMLPELKQPVTATTTDGIVSPSLIFRDMLAKPLPRGLVTLLGDAAHPVSPFRGEGGNHAILDAIYLAQCLGEMEQDSSNTYAAVLKKYEEDLLARSHKVVLNSRADINEQLQRQTEVVG